MVGKEGIKPGGNYMDDLTSKVENLAGKQNELEKLTYATYESFKSFVQEIKSKYKYIYKKGICGVKKYETKYLSVHYPKSSIIHYFWELCR